MAGSDSDPAARELQYYRQQVDRLAGESLRLDYLIAGLRHEQKQKRQAFALLAMLHQNLGAHMDLTAMFDVTVRSVNATLGMDRTIVLVTDSLGRYRPACWMGFTDEQAARLAAVTLAIPAELVDRGARMIVHKASEPTPLVSELRSAFDLPYFVSVPVTGEAGPLGLLVSGRMREAPPLYPALDQGDLDTLQALSAIVSAAVRSRRLVELETDMKAQGARIQVVSRIQEELLPKSMPSIPGYDIAGRSLSAQVVGGDYFDFISIDEHRMAICLGDVAGKGLPASLLMANLQATVRGQALWSPSACDCMTRANRLLFRSTDAAQYATVFYAVLNSRSHWLLYSNAGHNPPMLFSGDQAPERLSSGGTVVGLMQDSAYEEEVVAFRQGDLLVIYSDGISEATNAQDEEFGEERLADVVRAHRSSNAAAIVEALFAAVTAHAAGAPQSDDMTLVVVRR